MSSGLFGSVKAISNTDLGKSEAAGRELSLFLYTNANVVACEDFTESLLVYEGGTKPFEPQADGAVVTVTC